MARTLEPATVSPFYIVSIPLFIFRPYYTLYKRHSVYNIYIHSGTVDKLFIFSLLQSLYDTLILFFSNTWSSRSVLFCFSFSCGRSYRLPVPDFFFPISSGNVVLPFTTVGSVLCLTRSVQRVLFFWVFYMLPLDIYSRCWSSPSSPHVGLFWKTRWRLSCPTTRERAEGRLSHPTTVMEAGTGRAEAAMSTSGREAGGGAGDRGIHWWGSRLIDWRDRGPDIHRRWGRRRRLTSTWETRHPWRAWRSLPPPHNPHGRLWSMEPSNNMVFVPVRWWQLKHCSHVPWSWWAGTLPGRASSV